MLRHTKISTIYSPYKVPQLNLFTQRETVKLCWAYPHVTNLKQFQQSNTNAFNLI
jgi:hypothetical protein